MEKKTQPHLRLAGGTDTEHFDLCNLKIANAASPFGVVVRPRSMSLTAEGDSPTSSPMSASRKPVERRSEIRDAHVVMGPSVRPAVDLSQRSAVTAFRENMNMPRPPGMPALTSIGARIKWWRKQRKIERKALAKQVGMSYSALADLENNRSETGMKLHLIAAALRLNAYYLETGKGEPESEFAQEAPAEPQKWPFESVPISKIEKLNLIERAYAETKLLEAVQAIEAERRKSKKTG